MLSARQLSIEIFRILRFGIVGIAAAVCYALTTSLIVQTGMGSTIVATVVGHLAATGISYFGHLHFSFAVSPDHRIFLRRFLLIALAAIAINIGVTWLLTDRLGISYWFAIAAVTVLIPAVNYFCNRFWVFLPGIERPGIATSGKESPRASGRL